MARTMRPIHAGSIRGWPIAISSLLCLFTLTVSAAYAQRVDPGGLNLVCPLENHEHRRALEDSQMHLELLENEYRARKSVFEMVEKLWLAHAIEREAYLDYKRLRDRTKVRIARSRVQISQRSGMVEQYALTCAQIRGQLIDQIQQKVEKLQAEYRRLDCELLVRDAQIAEIDYQFDKAVLKATRELAEASIKSRYELVIEEYDLSQSSARVQAFNLRTANCKAQLAD